MGNLSVSRPRNKYRDVKPRQETKETSTNTTTLKKGVDYETTVMFDLTRPIKDIVGDETKLVSQKFMLKNNIVLFYLNSEKHEIIIDKVSHLDQDARLSIRLLNIPKEYTFKSVSIIFNNKHTVFVMLHKPDEDGRGKFLKAVKLDDIIKIEGDKIYYGD